MKITSLSTNLAPRQCAFMLLFLVGLLGLTTVASAHGGRHPERVDQRDAGWLTRLQKAHAVLWAEPRLATDGLVELKVLHVFKGELIGPSLRAAPVSVSRAKAQGNEAQVIFLTHHDADENDETTKADSGWHWSIGRHDLELKAPSLAAAKNYFSLQTLQVDGLCSGELAEVLSGVTYQSPVWQSKLALLDAFGICKSHLPRITKVSRVYLREAQRSHQSRQRRASPGTKPKVD